MVNDDYRKFVEHRLDALETNMLSGFQGVHARQDIANGKVNKIIIALVGLFFFCLGLGLKEAETLLSLIV